MEHRATGLRQHRQAHIVKPQTTAYLDEDIVDTLEAIDRLGDFEKIVASSEAYVLTIKLTICSVKNSVRAAGHATVKISDGAYLAHTSLQAIAGAG